MRQLASKNYWAQFERSPEFAILFLPGDQFLAAALAERADLLDTALLRKTFSFMDTPAGVALENGHEKAALNQFEGEEPAATLKKLGFAI